MANRNDSKQLTRGKILSAAKEKFIQDGYFRLSTLEVAELAQVAHGTVFFHFQTKENLILEVLDAELLQLSIKLNPLISQKTNFETLLSNYLDYLSAEESLFSILAKETPLYPAEMRRVVLGREAAIRQFFYQTLEEEVAAGRCTLQDITAGLTFLFGTLTYLLSLRESFIENGSVIALKKKMILRNFMQWISTAAESNNKLEGKKDE